MGDLLLEKKENGDGLVEGKENDGVFGSELVLKGFDLAAVAKDEKRFELEALPKGVVFFSSVLIFFAGVSSGLDVSSIFLLLDSSSVVEVVVSVVSAVVASFVSFFSSVPLDVPFFSRGDEALPSLLASACAASLPLMMDLIVMI